MASFLLCEDLSLDWLSSSTWGLFGAVSELAPPSADSLDLIMNLALGSWPLAVDDLPSGDASDVDRARYSLQRFSVGWPSLARSKGDVVCAKRLVDGGCGGSVGANLALVSARNCSRRRPQRNRSPHAAALNTSEASVLLLLHKRAQPNALSLGRRWPIAPRRTSWRCRYRGVVVGIRGRLQPGFAKRSQKNSVDCWSNWQQPKVSRALLSARAEIDPPFQGDTGSWPIHI